MIMMNCTDIQKGIDDFLDGELNPAQQAGFDAHLQDCASCRKQVAEERQRLVLLQSMPVPEPSPDFADRVIRAARQSEERRHSEEHLRHRRYGFVAGFGSALAAGFALWLVVGVLPQTPESVSPSQLAVQQTVPGQQQVAQHQDQAPGIPELTIALHESRDVTLAFNSVKVLNGATISIELPENVAIVGYPGRRTLEWQTDLDAGKNILRLPVVATGIAGADMKNSQLVARVKHGDKVTTYRINLNVGAPKVSEQKTLRQRIA
jgi:hypothetical protein